MPLKLWTQGIYRGNSFDTGGSTVIGDSFHLDMQLSYQVSTPLNLYLRGENLTDNRQSQVIGWDMPGRRFMAASIGLSYRNTKDLVNNNFPK